nr:hypothetical protein [Saccharothrix sp. ST-888]
MPPVAYPGAGSERDAQRGSVGGGLQPEQAAGVRALPGREELAAGQTGVARDAGVGHRAVEGGADLQRAGPVLRHQGGLQRDQVGLRLAGDPALHQPGAAALRVRHQGVPGEHASPQIQFQALVRGRAVEPVAALAAEGQRQPVGAVDQVLVVDDAARDAGGDAVVAPGQVRAGVVDAVRRDSGAAPRVTR